jgi:K+-transporting ATPase ATPase A chain
MSAAAIFQIVVLLVLLGVTVPPLGRYLAGVFGDPELGAEPEPTPGERVFGPIERVIYRACRIDPGSQQRWTGYAMSLLAFSLASVLALYALLRLQGVLPLNPDGFPAVGPTVAFNTAVSLRHQHQLAGLRRRDHDEPPQPDGGPDRAELRVGGVAGMAVIVAIIRGITRRRVGHLGNFWVDLTRTVVRVLVPMAFIACDLPGQPGRHPELLGDFTDRHGRRRRLPGRSPAARWPARRRSSSWAPTAAGSSTPTRPPLREPQRLHQPAADLGDPVASVRPDPWPTGDGEGPPPGQRLARRDDGAVAGSVLLAGMPRPRQPPAADRGADQAVAAQQGGGNLEGKETRFGRQGRAGCIRHHHRHLHRCGQLHARLDDPAGGGVALVNMLLGEVSPGGVGVGLMGLLIFALLAVFIAGLMVGERRSTSARRSRRPR